MALVNAGLATVSPVADGGTAHVSDTVAAYTSGIIHSFETNNVVKASIDFEGTYTGHDGIFAGLVTVAETLAVTGVATFSGQITQSVASAIDVNLRVYNSTSAGGSVQSVGLLLDYEMSSTTASARIYHQESGNNSSTGDLIFAPAQAGTATTVLTLSGVDLSATFAAALTISGVFDHNGSTFGALNATPAAQTAAYTPTNVTPDRAYDADSTTIDELADVIGTIIADLQLFGFFG